MAKKMAAKKKPAAKKPAAKPAKKPMAKKPAAKVVAKPKPKASGPRTPWFDATKTKPLLSEYAQRMQPFIDTMADGRIDEGEIAAQEERLIASMKEVEPLLDGDLHGKVTRLLCEMAAYDLMQALHGIQESRPKTVFRG